MVLVWVATSSSSGSLPISLKLLSLEHNWAKWWSVLTDGFCSASGQLLARNLFFGYMFGRVVENSESSGALWLTFLLSAAGEGAGGAILPLRQVLLPRQLGACGLRMMSGFWTAMPCRLTQPRHVR